MSAVYVRHNHDWLICDPGTGTYNGPLEVRNGFRTSAGHPVWHPAGVDQMDPHRAFRWLRRVRGYSAKPLHADGRVVLFGWHDAFENDASQTRVARAVVITKAGVLIKDFIENRTGTWQLTVPLPPGGDPSQFFGLDAATVAEGKEAPFAGWHSRTYGEWKPSKWLTVEATPADLPLWGCGIAPEGLDFSIIWSADSVILEVADGERHSLLRAVRD